MLPAPAGPELTLGAVPGTSPSTHPVVGWLVQKEQLGLFEHPYVDAVLRRQPCSTPWRTAPWRRAASASIVLLANDGVLPLQAGARIAVLGPSADDPRLLLGDYHFPAHLELQHEEAALSPVGSEFTALPPQNPTPSPLQALRQRVEVVDDTEQADVAVVFVGGRSGLTRADTSGEFRDAADFRLAARSSYNSDRRGIRPAVAT